MTLRMEKALKYIERFREVHGVRLTVTHLVAKAVAEALQRCPDANAILRFNKIYLRQGVTISILVVQTDQGDGKVDLTAAKIENAENKSLKEMADELQATIDRVRQRKEKSLEKGKKRGRAHPVHVDERVPQGARVLHVHAEPRRCRACRATRSAARRSRTSDRWGSTRRFVPLVPYTRVPIFVAPGAIVDEPVVENGKVVPGKGHARSRRASITASSTGSTRRSSPRRCASCSRTRSRSSIR